jgi:hypothetical protein
VFSGSPLKAPVSWPWLSESSVVPAVRSSVNVVVVLPWVIVTTWSLCAVDPEPEVDACNTI